MGPRLLVRALFSLIASLAIVLLCEEVGGWPLYIVLPICLIVGILIGLV